MRYSMGQHVLYVPLLVHNYMYPEDNDNSGVSSTSVVSAVHIQGEVLLIATLLLGSVFTA